MVNDLLPFIYWLCFLTYFFISSIFQLNSPFLTLKLIFFNKWPCYYFLQAWRRFSSSLQIFTYMNIYERLGLSVIFIPNNCQCSTIEMFLHFISSKYCVTPLAYIKMQLFLLHLGIWPNAFTLHLNTVSWLTGFSSRRKLSYFLFLFHMNKKIHSAKYSVWVMFFDCCCFQRQQSKLTLRTVFLNIK